MDKILLITGASSEVGLSLINAVADDYRYIWAHYNCNPAQIEGMQSKYEGKILPVKANFMVEAETRSMLETIVGSQIIPNHVVHLSSPNVFHQKFQKRQWEEYQAGIDVSLRSIVILLNGIVPYMARNRYGRIVFMLTSYLTGTAPKYQSAYITTKYALYGLMNTLAAEFAEKWVTVNAVSPDMMETKFLSNVPDVAIRMNAEANPLKRNIAIEDVIPTIRYLLSDDAHAITGQNIAITAGSELI